MSLASFSQRRASLRDVLDRDALSYSGSVFDPVSARLAALAGFEYGLFGGSIASHVVLAAPDITLTTLSEVADQVRRVCRASDLPVIVDADHGFGNALSVRRTTEELEAAGAAAFTIEDTLLPRRYGATATEYITREEFRDKLRAAIDARVDPSLVIIGRFALRDFDENLARVHGCIEAGVDAIFLNGNINRELLDAVRSQTRLPLVANRVYGSAEEMASLGVRLIYQGHDSYFVMLQALHDSYQTLRNGGRPEDLRAKSLSPELRRIALSEPEYDAMTKAYLA